VYQSSLCMCVIKLITFVVGTSTETHVSFVSKNSPKTVTQNSKIKKKLWKPECVWSFNMDWRIKFINIRQPMLKLKTHSGFHDLFRFWYVLEYKYGSIFWLEDGNLYLRLRKMSHTIYAANGKVSHIHRRMCEWDHTIDKSLVCLQSERRTSC
jgi:hypothetical protein